MSKMFQSRELLSSTTLQIIVFLINSVFPAEFCFPMLAIFTVTVNESYVFYRHGKETLLLYSQASESLLSSQAQTC